MDAEPSPTLAPVEPMSMLAEATGVVMARRQGNQLAHVPVVALLLWLGATEQAWRSNLVMCGAVLAYALVSGFRAHRYARLPFSEERARRTRRVLYVSLAALGLLYNVVFINLDLHGVSGATESGRLVVALFCAGGAAAYQQLRGLAASFILTGVLPHAAYVLWADPEAGGTTAFVLSVFAVFMTRTSLEMHADALERMQLNRELHAAKREAEQLARRDALTGLPNRRALFELGESAIASARRHGLPLSVVLLDIDRFKALNDQYGHAAGDAALAAVGALLRSSVRLCDVASRLGGEEFAVLLDNTDLEGARKLAERVRVSLHHCEPGPPALGISLRASFGVAELDPSTQTLGELLSHADTALYAAKASGRDRVVAHQPD